MKNQPLHFLFIIVLLGLISINSSWANDLNDFPGTIPLQKERGVQEDLDLGPFFETNGYASADDALPEDLGPLIDTSYIDPRPTIQWNPRGSKKLRSLPINESGEEFNYLDLIPSTNNWMRFTVESPNPKKHKDQKFFKIFFSRNAHNALLRAALLQKLGYRIPPIKYLKNFRLNFASKAKRDDFIHEHMRGQLDAFPDRWITNIYRQEIIENSEDPDSEKATVEMTENEASLEEADSNDAKQSGEVRWLVTEDTADCLCLYVQDAVAFYSDSNIYNLPLGFVKESMLLSRRTFQALLVPFGLTYVDESVNMFSWHFGRVSNDRIIVPYEHNAEFYPKYEDAKWVSLKILDLSEQDWQDIVDFGEYPVAVNKLLKQKLISRRNDLIELFGLERVYDEYTIEPNISYTADNGEQQLKEGKLLKTEWPGYAPTFGYGDPESPLSNTEMFALFKSKLTSNIINNLVNEVNLNWLPKTDLQRDIAEHQFDLAVDALVEGFAEGKKPEIPFGMKVFPYAGGSIIASREIVTGRIMGTENPIQLSHTIGASVHAGAYVGVFGLNPGVLANGRAQAYVTRTYSHLKPVSSISKASKQKFKNIFVPFIAGELGHKFDQVRKGAFDNLEDLPPPKRKERQTELLEILSDFYNNFSPGESLIISDYIGGLAEINVGYSFSTVHEFKRNLALQLNARSELQLLSRLHIFRKSESEIQIYEGNGLTFQLRLSIDLNVAFADILGVHYKKIPYGQATTKFSELNMRLSRDDDGFLTNRHLTDNIKILNQLFSNFRTETLYSYVNPITINHDFKQSGWGFHFFSFVGRQLETLQRVKFDYRGDPGDYIRYSEGYRNGVDWESFGLKVLTAVIKNKIPDSNISVSSNSSGDPGDTFMGHSKNRIIFFEGRKKEGQVTDPFITLERRWRGWVADKETLKGILDEINSTYPVKRTTFGDKFKLYRKLDLKDTELIQLYSVYLNLNVYERGLIHLAHAQKSEFKPLFLQFASNSPYALGPYSDDHRGLSDGNWADDKADEFAEAQTDFLKSLDSGDMETAAKSAYKMIDMADEYFEWKEFLKLMGGIKNVFISSKVIGFRVGDEMVDENSLLHKPFYSRTLGEVGSPSIHGPLSFATSEMGATESEMFLTWVLERQ